MEDHGEIATSKFAPLHRIHVEDIFPLIENLPFVDFSHGPRQKTHKGKGGDAFAAAAFADDGKGGAFGNGKAHAVYSVYYALIRIKGSMEIFKFD
ncbi:hypothetical protein HMPREF1863_00605 [Aedoeadaptatus coxii]|uniref:Uncharacterized protein n=1 Tax=Aedoeadaptatus coxii TaxID=755172 RepID=A0A134AIE3_9FIRM|nr:hypothetical protein HMPREF1863_00605 [Peptoniphilus coxii]